MSGDTEDLRKKFAFDFSEWLGSCKRKGNVSRNTLAVGLVVLQSLREKCPLGRDDIISSGGEIKRSRSGLKHVLEKYGIPRDFLKEVTTRQGHQDGQRLLEMMDYGEALARISSDERDAVLGGLTEAVVGLMRSWFERQNLRIACRDGDSPCAWIRQILAEAKGRSGGAVEQHLVGAKLESRHPGVDVPALPSHAGDLQTGRAGDFAIGTTTYHVTASPSRDVISKCRANVDAGGHAVLLVPGNQVDRAKLYAEDEGLGDQLSVFAIEDFLGANVIEMAAGGRAEFVKVLRGIIKAYNRRIEEAETDKSLKIELF